MLLLIIALVPWLAVQLAAHLAATLELPHTSVSAMATVRSKLAFREACAQAGLPCPRFLRLGLEHTSPAALAQQLSAAGMQFPVVVKPTCLAGSFAVCRVDTLDQLAAAAQRFYQQQLPQYAAAQGLSLEAVCAQGGMIVEELLVGQEVGGGRWEEGLQGRRGLLQFPLPTPRLLCPHSRSTHENEHSCSSG
jgi:biotin carboxylase